MNDLRFALRQIGRNPGFSIVAVLTLALGIGVNTALFSVVNGVLLRPLPFPEHERLVTLWESDPGRGAEQLAVSPPTFSDWTSQSVGLEGFAYWTGPTDFNLATREGPEKVQATYASSAVFSLLRIPPILGRTFVPEEDRREGPRVAVISHRLWQDRFGGSPEVLGQSLTVDTFGRRDFSIIGVMPQGFQFPGDSELWLASGWNGLPADRRNGHWLSVMARLKPGVRLEHARAELNVIQARIAQQNPRAQTGTEVSAVPLLQQTVGRSMRTTLMVLWGVVAVVLLIACANVANLMLARAAVRQREIALRLALGAARARVMRQLLTESLLLAALGGIAGTLLGAGGLRLIVAFSPGNVPRLSEISLDATAWWFTAGIAMVTGLVFGMAPAWVCSRPDLNTTLKDSSRGASAGASASLTRNSLVVVEVALATLLLVGAGLMLQSFARLLSTERGFRAEQLVTAELDFSVSGFTTWVRSTATRPQIRLREIMERLRQVPGVQSVAASSGFLRRENRPPSWKYWVHGRDLNDDSARPLAEERAISPDYLRTLGMRIIQGRDFTESDDLDSPGVMIVNESFARRYFPDENPIGKHLTGERTLGPLGGTNVWGQSIWAEIVGVVSDVKSLTAQPDAIPEVYRPYWQWPMQRPTLYVRATTDARTLANAIRRETKAVTVGLPAPRVRTMIERVGESTAAPRFQAGLLALFGGLALALAACGIYGVLAYSVSLRRREIGVRLALGAQRSNVLGLILNHGLKLTLLGIGVGAAGAFALTRVLRSLLYEVRPTDPATFAGVAVLLVLVAAFACWWPARAAARTDPLEALRAE